MSSSLYLKSWPGKLCSLLQRQKNIARVVTEILAALSWQSTPGGGGCKFRLERVLVHSIFPIRASIRPEPDHDYADRHPTCRSRQMRLDTPGMLSEP